MSRRLRAVELEVASVRGIRPAALRTRSDAPLRRCRVAPGVGRSVRLDGAVGIANSNRETWRSTWRTRSPSLIPPAGPGAVRRAARHPHRRRWLRGPRSVLCAAVVVAAASGCETIAPEVQDTAIVTAGNSFQLVRGEDRGHTWYRATIPYSFTNRTGSKVYIDPGCGDRHHYVEWLVWGEWSGFVSRVDCAIGVGFRAIEPGEVYQDTLRTGGCTSGGSCWAAPDSAGRFHPIQDRVGRVVIRGRSPVRGSAGGSGSV